VKVAVYAIAKDEERFVKRWQESACEADSLHILDTGSYDRTIGTAKDYGIDVSRWEFNPWRFDKARNMALELVPLDYDYCIALDLDEVLIPGWREHLERAHEEGVTRPRYKYTWSWKNGQPDLQYGGDKIHTRQGYCWKHPVHEVITPLHGFKEVQGWVDLEIHHHPDSKKSRSQYMPLLELAVTEDPSDDRNMHYYARELFFAGRMGEAKSAFLRHLDLPKAQWKPERAQSYRYLYKIDKDPRWLAEAAREHLSREVLVDMARYNYEQQEWQGCFNMARRALEFAERPLEYFSESEAWGPLAHDFAAIAAYQLGLFREAAWHGMEALKLSPYDTRLVDNLGFYEKAAA